MYIHSPNPPMVDEYLPMDEKMAEEHWMTGLGKQHGDSGFRSWRCIMRMRCFFLHL